MTREELVRLMYMSGHCPKYGCLPTTLKQCKECHNKELSEYEDEIYNKAIEDFKVEMYNKLFNGVTTFTSIFSIYEIAEELKKGNDNDTLEKAMRFKKVKDEFLELKKGAE